jgi:hypothetical protein
MKELNILLQRNKSANGATISTVYVDGKLFCFACEDEVREVPGVPVEKWKIKGITAIPTGRYKVIINMSYRFKKIMPLLLNVPGFDGIRIHPGNTSLDTDGCILPGMKAGRSSVSDSRRAYEKLFTVISETIKQDGDVFIEIKNAV